MKKTSVLLSLLSLTLLYSASVSFAADETPAPAEASPVASSETVQPATTAPEPVVTPVEATTSAPVVASSATTAPAAVSGESAISENLEFVSGEVSAVDVPAKTVTVKLYGETDEKTSDKVLTVKIDNGTDITNGDKDLDLGSLAAGTEVDVEYDPASNKATYIFVY